MKRKKEDQVEEITKDLSSDEIEDKLEQVNQLKNSKFRVRNIEKNIFLTFKIKIDTSEEEKRV